MRRYGIMTIMASIIVVTIVAATDAAVTVDKTASIGATGTVDGSTSLSVSPATITFGTTTTNTYPTTPIDKKVVITYSSNFNPWKIMVYTNNTTVLDYVDDGTSTQTRNEKYGRYAKGGLASTPIDDDGNPGTPSISTQVVPCKWVSKVGTNTTPPVLPTGPTTPGGTDDTYNFVKDKRDQNDPATTGPDKDESWASALNTGYVNIAFGNPGGGFCVDPEDSIGDINGDGDFADSGLGEDGDAEFVGDVVTPTSGIAVYIAGGFGTSFLNPTAPAGAGTYSSSIYFDLYHE